MSWLLLALFLLQTMKIQSYQAVEELANGLKDYNENFYIWWSITYLLFVVGIFIPLVSLKYQKYALQAQAWVGFALILAILGLTYLGSIKTGTTLGSDNSRLLIGLIAALTTGLGWAISHQYGQKKHRISHTYKVLLDSRLSSAFQDKYSTMLATYPVGIDLDEKQVNKYINQEIMDINHRQAIDCASYVIDYYEFIASGILAEDLDNEFLYQNARAFVCGMYYKCLYFITEIRKENNQPKAWNQLEALVKEWDKRYKTDNKRLECEDGN